VAIWWDGDYLLALRHGRFIVNKGFFWPLCCRHGELGYIRTYRTAVHMYQINLVTGNVEE